MPAMTVIPKTLQERKSIGPAAHDYLFL